MNKSTSASSALSLPAPNLFARLVSAIRTAWKAFFHNLRSYPGVLVFLAGYAFLRVTLNLSIGITVVNAVRPLLLGLLFNAVMILVIDTLHFLIPPQQAHTAEIPSEQRRRYPAALIILLLVWIFWAIHIIDKLQVSGEIPGTPLLNWLPGWRALESIFLSAGQALARSLPALPAEAYAAALGSLTLRFMLPLVILWALGLFRQDSYLTFRRGFIAAPFLLIALGMFLANGLTGKALTLLGVTLLYPGLVEEMLYRGWMQRLFQGWLRPGYAILVGAILFGLLHLPEFAAVRYGLPLGLTNMGDVILTGIVWGYGVERTRSVLPWAAYHALSNVVGF